MGKEKGMKTKSAAMQSVGLFLFAAVLLLFAGPSRGVAGERTFINPKWNGHIVDNCRLWATDCNGGGAHNFCRLKGYKKAVRWKLNKPGTTYVIGSKKVCRGSFCTGYSSITCTTGGTGASSIKVKACRNYANHAISQQQQNIKRNCGYRGPRWHKNFNNHYNWCMKNYGTGRPASEAKIRQRELNRCKLKPTGKIQVLSATYGGNCGVPKGNVTRHIANQCRGKSTCRYVVDHKVIGDPAHGCAKTYVVRYRCSNGPRVYTKSLSAEAGWGNKSVILSCP